MKLGQTRENLISAAPDMLEELKRLRAIIISYQNETQIMYGNMAHLESVIAKAEGRDEAIGME